MWKIALNMRNREGHFHLEIFKESRNRAMTWNRHAQTIFPALVPVPPGGVVGGGIVGTFCVTHLDAGNGSIEVVSFT